MNRRRVVTDEQLEVTVTEAEDRFEGEWILMRVTAYDEFHEASRGKILAHSKQRKRINDALAREPRPSELAPGADPREYSIFKAIPRIQTGESWGRVLKQAAQLPESSIPRPW